MLSNSEKLKKLNTTLICDNRRIKRFFQQRLDTFYLPLTYFENNKLKELKKI